MSQFVGEFIFFKVKPSVRPEDPASEEGEALLRVFHIAKQQSSHNSSVWGRTLEDENVIVWVIEWTDARGSTPIEKLKPFLAEAPQPPTALYTILHPPLSDTDTMTANPVTEICLLPFPSNLSAAESRELNAQLIDFRIAQLEQLPQAERPKSCSMGHIDRPSTVHHDSSPSGRAMLHVLAVGWESVEAHMKAKKTDQFTQSIAPIRKKVLPPVPGLEMRHVSFKKIE